MNSYIVNYVLTGMRGGMNRIDILKLLLKDRLNANQIKEKLGIDYKTVQHHLRLLIKNKFIAVSGNKYGAFYHITEEFKIHKDEFNQILAKINKLPERR